MIPASYLFKNTYRQHWEEPDATIVVERSHRFIDGLTSPIAAAVTALLSRRHARGEHHFGGHAYE